MILHRRRLATCLFLIFAACWAAVPPSALAQEATPIAILDMERILRESKAAATLRQEISAVANVSGSVPTLPALPVLPGIPGGVNLAGIANTDILGALVSSTLDVLPSISQADPTSVKTRPRISLFCLSVTTNW